MNQVRPEHGHQAAAEQDQRPAQQSVPVTSVRDVAGQEAPQCARAQANHDFYRAVQNQMKQVTVPDEDDAKEDPKPANRHHVTRGAGGDDDGVDAPVIAVSGLHQRHQARDDDGGGRPG